VVGERGGRSRTNRKRGGITQVSPPTPSLSHHAQHPQVPPATLGDHIRSSWRRQRGMMCRPSTTVTGSSPTSSSPRSPPGPIPHIPPLSTTAKRRSHDGVVVVWGTQTGKVRQVTPRHLHSPRTTRRTSAIPPTPQIRAYPRVTRHGYGYGYTPGPKTATQPSYPYPHHGYGFSRVRVRVRQKVPAGYPCRTLAKTHQTTRLYL